MVASILGLLALMISMDEAYAAMAMIVLFLFINGWSVEGLHWIYIPEILSDTQFGFVASFHYVNGVVISVVSEPMFKYLRPEGTFLFFCAVSSLGFIFMYFHLLETEGLSDREKKALYFPSKYILPELQMEESTVELETVESIEPNEAKIDK